MKLVWSLGALVCLSILGILISSMIVLSLIPLYTPIRETILSTEGRTKNFSFSAAFTKLSNRDLSDVSLDYVDASSLPYAERFLQNLLITQANFPRRISIDIKEIEVVYTVNNSTYNTLYFVGEYIFDPFCNAQCQNKIFNTSFNSLSLSDINATFSVLIHQVGQDFILWNLTAVNLTNTNEIFNLTYTLSQNSSSRSFERALNANEDKSARALVANTFALINGYKNIPFIIISKNIDNSSNTPMLHIQLQVKYPVFYIDTILDEIRESILYTLSNIWTATNFVYTSESVTYRVLAVNTVFPAQSTPVTINKLEYALGDDFANITLGPITDQNTIANISAAIKNSFGEPDIVQVESISIEEVKRRTANKSHVLVVIIRFIFNFLMCNRYCQANIVSFQLEHVHIPEHVFINNIFISLPLPTIYRYGQSTPLYNITIAATTTTGSTATITTGPTANATTEPTATITTEPTANATTGSTANATTEPTANTATESTVTTS